MPTLFAVGDEKQSIYGFQGAKPELLHAFGVFYEDRALQAGLDWCEADLDLSFRTLGPVLAAVDLVSAALPGLQQGKPVQHLAYRRHAGGMVELWQPERGEREEKGSVWEPDAAAAPAGKPAEALAARIAAQIKHWLESGEGLPSPARPIEPGDILILLRKREPMARLIQAALKRENVPVAGTDRIALTDELAVMDLLALAGALLQPEDDLALASRAERAADGAWRGRSFQAGPWPRRLRCGRPWSSGPDYDFQAKKLSAWRGWHAARAPSIFSLMYWKRKRRPRGVSAQGSGRNASMRSTSFSALAETFSARPLASLGEFVSFARKSASEVKRETDQAAREVRIMTVHGAKGLEANVVILADTCGNKSAAPAPVFFLDDGTGAPEIPVWAVKGTGGLRSHRRRQGSHQGGRAA